MNDVGIPVLGNRKHKSGSGLCSAEDGSQRRSGEENPGGDRAAQPQESRGPGQGGARLLGDCPLPAERPARNA